MQADTEQKSRPINALQSLRILVSFELCLKGDRYCHHWRR
jgi:hypothetical protein